MQPMQRARSETAKLAREDSILTATEILLRQSGYDCHDNAGGRNGGRGWQKERSIYISPAASHLFLRFMAGCLIAGLTGLLFISLN
jgi:hypothetical protein